MDHNIINFLNKNYSQEATKSLVLLTGGGSGRIYYRFWYNNQPYILCQNNNIDENKTFLYYTEKLNKTASKVPSIFKISKDYTLYVQSDLGDQTFMNVILNDRNKAKDYYFQIIDVLAKTQLEAGKSIDFHQAYSYPKLDKTLVLRDLFLFKFYFLNNINVTYNQGKLLKDFDLFASQFDQLSPKGFVFRDFQSRNIIIKDHKPYFIDYQGGVYGPIFYDLVSLLWQAKANIPIELKNDLYNHYFEQIKQLDNTIVPIDCKISYEYCVVARLLQVLGAYGLRGLIEKKTHFTESISFALDNLKLIIDYPILQNYPELKKIIITLIEFQIKEQINNIING